MMSAGTLISVEEYLRTSYHPDREYRDGVVLERNVGSLSHAKLQTLLSRYIGNRARDWNVEVFVELRIRAREGWLPIPDIAVYERPAPTEEVPTRLPLLWIEILSNDDTIKDVREKIQDAIACGAPWLWVIDPVTLESDLWSAAGKAPVPNQTLRLPGSPIVIPLREVIED